MGFGEGGGHRPHIPEVQSFIKPQMTRYFFGEHINLSAIAFMCDFTDKNANIFELWETDRDRQRSTSVFCVGQIAPSDLWEVTAEKRASKKHSQAVKCARR